LEFEKQKYIKISTSQKIRTLHRTTAYINNIIYDQVAPRWAIKSQYEHTRIITRHIIILCAHAKFVYSLLVENVRTLREKKKRKNEMNR
jgi:hypothetical protein